ncbi:MAG: DUF1361 domain-containing protein [Oscillochloridaceae bacterium umkhey_bin13]
MRWLISLHRLALSHLFYPCLAATILAVGLLVGRNLFGARGYGFLIWNLFLAWLPYLAAIWVAQTALLGRAGRILALPVALLWLLFLPNAPYLVTDLIHLPGMRFVWWYDAGTMFAFILAGCLLGVCSLQLMSTTARRLYGPLIGWLVLIGASLLSGVGVYLGRFLRWNSWDALLRPGTLLRELLTLLTDPATYPRLIGVSGMIAAFMLVLYLSLHAARSQGELG